MPERLIPMTDLYDSGKIYQSFAFNNIFMVVKCMFYKVINNDFVVIKAFPENKEEMNTGIEFFRSLKDTEKEILHKQIESLFSGIKGNKIVYIYE